MSGAEMKKSGCSRTISETNAENEQIIGGDAGSDKRLATLKARFALLGHELHLVTKEGRTFFEVRRWGQCKACSTMHDLEGFFAQLTGGRS